MGNDGTSAYRPLFLKTDGSSGLRQIPDILLKLYPPNKTDEQISLRKVTRSITPEGMSKRIIHAYPENYWREGCILTKGEPHSSHQARHVKCNIGGCNRIFHSKFEVKYHKKTYHAY